MGKRIRQERFATRSTTQPAPTWHSDPDIIIRIWYYPFADCLASYATHE